MVELIYHPLESTWRILCSVVSYVCFIIHMIVYFHYQENSCKRVLTKNSMLRDSFAIGNFFKTPPPPTSQRLLRQRMKMTPMNPKAAEPIRKKNCASLSSSSSTAQGRGGGKELEEECFFGIKVLIMNQQPQPQQQKIIWNSSQNR